MWSSACASDLWTPSDLLSTKAVLLVELIFLWEVGIGALLSEEEAEVQGSHCRMQRGGLENYKLPGGSRALTLCRRPDEEAVKSSFWFRLKRKHKFWGVILEKGLQQEGWQGASLSLLHLRDMSWVWSCETLRISCLVCDSIWTIIPPCSKSVLGLVVCFLHHSSQCRCKIINLQTGTLSEGMGQIYVQWETNQQTSICTVNTPECTPIIMTLEVQPLWLE